MAICVRNDRLEEAKKDPSILTGEEISAASAELLRTRKKLAELKEKLCLK